MIVTIRSYIGKALRLPPHVVARKALAIAPRKLVGQVLHQLALRHGTYFVCYPPGTLNQYLTGLKLSLLEPHKECLLALTNHYLAHYFDLLGSGWVQVKHGMHCRGIEGYRYDMGYPIQPYSAESWLDGRINSANLAESQRIWSLVAQDYTPIDWHLDFKSGYRWSEATWYRDITYGQKLGVDIKVPWELARMQHLPQLAWAYALASTQQPSFASAPKYADEFRNQVLDFIATNPPRFGVNWRCTMDVAIRVANWLVAYDLFRAYGAEFDSEFEVDFSRSVYQHGLHIINNLEWSPEHRANHYLADIVGLLFVAAYLPRTAEIDVWLAFAVQELIVEVEYQFYPDGGNFEASTSYHRLSAEMVVYATALVLGLPPEKQAALKGYNHRLHRVHPKLKRSRLEFYPLPGSDSDRLIPFPTSYIERLEKMAEFTMHITKPNGHIPQIGDNDSGRFLKLQPVYHQMSVAEAKACYANLEGYTDLPDDAVYWDKDILDHRHLVAAINGLFGRDDLAAFTGEGWLETDLIRCLAGGIQLPSYLQPGQHPAAELVHVGTEKDWVRFSAKLDSLTQGKHTQVLEIPIPGDDLCKNLKLYAYPDFGLYLYRSSRLYLAVRCGAIGQNGKGGHAHNDQLSIELNVDGEDWISDPGTYLYTPLPARRNQYRSVKAHFAPQLEGQEPGRLDLGLFQLGDESTPECLYFRKKGFVGCQRFLDFLVERSMLIQDRQITLIDKTRGKVYQPLIYLNEQLNNYCSINYSTAYGISFKNKVFYKDKLG